MTTQRIQQTIISEVSGTKTDSRLYFVYYIKSNVLKTVSKSVFIKVKGKFFKFGKNNHYCKIYGMQTSTRDAHFSAEGMCDEIKSCFSGLQLIIKVLTKLGKVANNSVNLDTLFIGQVLSFVYDVYGLLQSTTLQVCDFVQVLVNGYMIFARVKRGEGLFYTKGDKKNSVFKAEGMDALGLAVITSFLPNKVASILQRLNMLTSQKIMDDKSIFHDLLCTLSSLVLNFVEYLPVSDNAKTQMKRFLNILNISEKHVLVSKMEKINMDFRKDAKNYLKRDLLEDCRKILEQVNTCDTLQDWSRLSRSVQCIIDAFRHNVKILENNCSTSRVEPVCLVFEGPAGCGKSVAMSSVIQSLGFSSYSHVTKSMMDGKDFYDSYNNETVFYTDDMGQQGNSQWRHIINMVSPVRLPLDCAEAKLKDTKFFNSEFIFASTNGLRNINLMSNDCIMDINALWRRCIIVDCSEVEMSSVTGFYKGKVKILFYDLKNKNYEAEFPLYVKEFLESKSLEFNPELVLSGDSDSKFKLIAWLCDFVTIMRSIRQQQAKRNQITDKELSVIKEYRTFVGESLGSRVKKHINRFNRNKPNLSDLSEEEEEVGIKDNLNPFLSEDAVEYNKENDSVYIHRLFEPMVNKNKKNIISWFKELFLSAFADMSAWLEDKINAYDDMFTMWLSVFKDILLMAFFGLCGYLMVYYPLRWYVKCKMQKWIKNWPYLVDDHEKYLRGEAHRCEWRKWYSNQITFEELHSAYFESLNSFMVESLINIEHGLPTDVVCVAKQVKPVDCVYKDQSVQKCFGIISGHSIILPSHVVIPGEFYVNVYNDVNRTHRLIDNMLVRLVWSDSKADVAIVRWNRLKLSPWKNLSKFFRSSCEVAKNPFLVNAMEILPLSAIRSSQTYSAIYAYNPVKKIQFENRFTHDDYFYMKRGKGMCGVPIVDQEAGVLGIHVSGSETHGVGVAIKWSAEVRGKLHELLVDDSDYLLNLDISNEVKEGISATEFDTKVFKSVPSASKIVESPLHNIYPIERSPADLEKYGHQTVVKVAAKSLQHLKSVDGEELEFAGKVVSAIIPRFDALSEYEIVKGNQWLAGLNKDSSNGYDCKQDKSYYIDFEKGCFTPQFRDELLSLEMEIETGKIENFNKLTWFETLKDEIRCNTKDGVPRSFRVSTIHVQVLTKKYFGGLVQGILKDRDFNKIMVGCNPAKDWHRMYETLQRSYGVFDGDIAKYDGGMLTQVVSEVCKQILNKCDTNTVVTRFLLANLDNCLVVILNKLILTTHSMPSGSFLTAILNSIVNRAYTAMWFYREGGRTVDDFYNHIVDYVYGDDKVVGVSEKYKHLTARSFADFLESIGLGFTDAKKQKVDYDFMSLEDVTFLKRGFIYHNKLKRVMCPLSLTTLQSGLSWFDSSKEEQVVMEGKISAYQREIYLHPNYEHLRDDFEKRMEKYNYPYVRLPESYLYELYSDPNYEIPIKFAQYL